jgi:hypothetical protein
LINKPLRVYLNPTNYSLINSGQQHKYLLPCSMIVLAIFHNLQLMSDGASQQNCKDIDQPVNYST